MNFRPVAGRMETLRFGACLAFCVLASSPGRTQQGPMPTDFGPYGPPLTLDMAKRAMEAADGIARKNGWNVAIAIVDSAEHLVLFQKFDNTLYASISVAEGKARTALKFRRPTKTLEDAITRGGNGLRYLSVRDITPLEGGIPIVSGGKVVGAIGVSGVASANDELTATAGAEALKQPRAPTLPRLRAAKAFSVADRTEAACARDRVAAALQGSLGRVVGSKAGLTSKAVQERFKADAPVMGILLEGMILGDGATVPADQGARPVWEADMLLVVKDEGINRAKTPEEALSHISGMRPFIELPDLALAPGEALDGVQLTALNVAARLGVAGTEIPLRADADTVRLLAETSVVVTDEGGAVLARSTGAATLGNPLNAVLWLVQELAGSGRALVAGDLISVGSFTPLTPPKPGQRITVRYEGFPGKPGVSVRFR